MVMYLISEIIYSCCAYGACKHVLELVLEYDNKGIYDVRQFNCVYLFMRIFCSTKLGRIASEKSAECVQIIKNTIQAIVFSLV